jgi:hypothetical protein
MDERDGGDNVTAELAVPPNQSMEARPSSGLALSFAEMAMRVTQLDQFYREVMCEGTDYGKIPGTDKPTLYQPGAQMLDQIFGYVPTFEVAPSTVIDWTRPIPFFHYVILCRLVSRRSGETVAEGIGSCNSYEDKYRWRNAKRVCPSCKVEAIIKGKAEYGGGWLCFKKNNGCGAKFRDGDASVEGQAAGRVENEDSASLENTISKMAQKRAHIAATLNATGASRIFTQDVEDLPQFQQATIVEARSEPERGPLIIDPRVSEDDAALLITERVSEWSKPKTAASEPRKSTPARPVQPQPEPAAKEVTRARAMQDTPMTGTSRPQLIASFATIIRKQREAGADVRMPTGEVLKGLTDDDLQKMVTDTAAALAAATPAE